MALHENDYDVARTVDFFFEGGNVAEDWQTVGIRNKKQQPSDDAAQDLSHSNETSHNGTHSKTKSGGARYGGGKAGGSANANRNAQQQRDGGAKSGRKPDQPDAKGLPQRARRSQGSGSGGGKRFPRLPTEHGNEQSNETDDLNDQFVNMGVRDDEQINENGADGEHDFDDDPNQAHDSPNRLNNNYARNGGMRRPNRGGSNARGGGNIRSYQRSQNPNRPSNFVPNKGPGMSQPGARPNNRNSNEFKRYNNNNGTNLKNNSNGELINSSTSSGNLKNDDMMIDHIGPSSNTLEDENTCVLEKSTSFVNSNIQLDKSSLVGAGQANAGQRIDDSLRDIGTWSNEQASDKASGSNFPNKKALHYNRQFNNRYQGPGGGQGAPNNKNANIEDYDNDEEWQGDLTKTQIFTASAQKKDHDAQQSHQQQQQPAQQSQQSNESSSNSNQLVQSRPDKGKPFDSNFPIGHFDAEEATQNIKRAVGVCKITSNKFPFKFPLKSPLSFYLVRFNQFLFFVS